MNESTGERRRRHRRAGRTLAFACLLAGGGLLLCRTPVGAQEPEPVAGSSPEAKGLEIARRSNRWTAGYEDYEALLTMVLVSRDGKETDRRMEVSALATPDDGDRTLLVFRSPRDLQGTALLTHSHAAGNDDQWLYLPATKRVKRIAAARQSGSFMGSEFAYEDIGSQQVEKFTYRYIGKERLEGIPVHVVDRFPIDPGSGYSRQRVYLEAEDCLPLRIEYFDSRGEHFKTLDLDDYVELDPYRRAGTMTMTNHRTGGATRLHWSDFRFDAGLTERRFTPDGLARQGW